VDYKGLFAERTKKAGRYTMIYLLGGLINDWLKAVQIKKPAAIYSNWLLTLFLIYK
jgi:hypothetical protein